MSLPADSLPLVVRDSITSTLVSLTSTPEADESLVVQFQAVRSCGELEAAVDSLCRELLAQASECEQRVAW